MVTNEQCPQTGFCRSVCEFTNQSIITLFLLTEFSSFTLISVGHCGAGEHYWYANEILHIIFLLFQISNESYLFQ